jgi:hypothetical protein
VITG